MWTFGNHHGQPEGDESARIDALLQEVQFRIDEQRQRRTAMASRAAILVASAAITVSLLDLGADKTWVVVATLLTIVAASLGVYALFPGKGSYPDLMVVRSSLYDTPLHDARSRVIDDKIQYYLDAKPRLERQGSAVRWGFVALGLAIASSGVATILGAAVPPTP